MCRVLVLILALMLAVTVPATAQDAQRVPEVPKIDKGQSQGVPDRDAGPERERVEEQAKATAHDWAERVRRFEQEPQTESRVDNRGSTEQLKRSASALLQDVERLSQVQDEHFTKVYAEFVEHEKEMRRVWDNVQSSGKVGPRAKN
jgi:hypothetical protein